MIYRLIVITQHEVVLDCTILYILVIYTFLRFVIDMESQELATAARKNCT